MDLLEKNKQQIKKDFLELTKKEGLNVEINQLEEELGEIITDNVLTNPDVLTKWCSMEENQSHVRNAESDADSDDSDINIKKEAVRLELQSYGYGLLEEEKNKQQTEKDFGFVGTDYLVPCGFCNECGADLYVCDSCNVEFTDGELIYCSKNESKHICEKCMEKKLKQQIGD